MPLFALLLTNTHKLYCSVLKTSCFVFSACFQCTGFVVCLSLEVVFSLVSSTNSQTYSFPNYHRIQRRGLTGSCHPLWSCSPIRHIQPLTLKIHSPALDLETKCFRRLLQKSLHPQQWFPTEITCYLKLLSNVVFLIWMWFCSCCKDQLELLWFRLVYAC